MRLPPVLRVLAALALVALAGLATFSRVELRTDMAAFLPPGSTPATEFLLRELRSGAATTLILVGIENAPPEELAAISKAMQGELSQSGLFSFVNNGGEDFAGAAQEFLFEHRYLLSSVTRPDAFTEEALHAKLEELLRGLASSASPLVKRFGIADPIGAFLDIVKLWIGESRIEQRDGVWFAAGKDRALMIAKTKAEGLDPDAQRPALHAIDAAFHRASAERTSAGSARLLVSGPAIFSLEAAEAIRGDVRLISIISGVLIAALLLWRFRSPLVIATIAIPLGLSVIVAAIVVQAAFGFVHGITLGFGMTMLGVTVDYPILLIGQRRPGEAPRIAARRIWPTMLLAAAAAALGLTGMLLSSFPGLTQLGAFSIVGLAVAAAATRWILPLLLPPAAASGRTLPIAAPAASRGLWRYRAWLVLPIALAAAYLAITGGPRWETDLAALSPVPRAQQELDAELRREIGAPDVRYVIAIRAADAEGVLRAAERLDPALAALARSGAIGGAELVSRYLPSRETQLARRAALPTGEELASRLATAAEGMPFREGAFQPFIDAVVRSRDMAPVTRADIKSPLVAARIDALLLERDGEWFGLVPLVEVRDGAAVAAAVAGLADPQLTYIDIKDETNGLVARYTEEAAGWVGAGALAVLLALALGLRRIERAGRVALPIAGAAVVTLAVLALLQVQLTLFHLVSLLLMVGVSIDYALFFERTAESADEASRTLRAIVTCNATTLLTFGLLAFCRTPILHSIGLTVAIGVFCAIVFAFAFASRPPAA